ncbi:DUF418 domain-containing protein [Lysinibacillus capsici]|uniref:DUF418 domain-containing protein n=1 Tax=Lysinibacillus capsici TaxID=2115968 RepID=UPI002E1D974C|nr:heparan-alpha-glucosaminide N-acetyltransferase domain-containing protein [Lysinibacillus capsici]
MTKRNDDRRIEGLDFARALAMLGMFIVNFGVITGSTTNGSTWLIAFQHLFEGRASAVFVMLAGIGTALMTRQARESKDPILLRQNRLTLWKRALLLFTIGIILYAIGWTGDILHYYGVYMFVAAWLIAQSKKMMIFIIGVILILSQWLQIQFSYLAGWHPTYVLLEYLDFWTPAGFIRNLMFNGYHPLFPWICFFLIGMVVGTLDLTNHTLRKNLLVIGLLLVIMTETCSTLFIKMTTIHLLDVESALYLFDTGPIPPNMMYVLSNSASAIVIIVGSIYLVETCKNKVIQSFILTGQMSLTHYVGHVVIGIGILIICQKLENQTLAFSMLYACCYFLGCVVVSVWWRTKHHRGPLEFMMRKWSL